MLTDLVHRDSDTAAIELTISLSSFPALEEKYGSHLKLVRTIHRGVSLSTSTFEISSEGNGTRHPTTSKTIGLQGLRSLLTDLNLHPVYFPLLHLDRKNIQRLVENPKSWLVLTKSTSILFSDNFYPIQMDCDIVGTISMIKISLLKEN
jgi:hypothetical protein